MATTLRVRAVTLTFIKTKQPTGWKALLLLLLLDKFFKGLGQSPLHPGEEAILGAGLFLFFNMSAGSQQKTEPCITSCSNGSVEAGSVPPAGREPILCHDTSGHVTTATQDGRTEARGSQHPAWNTDTPRPHLCPDYHSV